VILKQKNRGFRSAHGLERFGICLLLFSALQADRSNKNNTGSKNNQSCLKN
jgi:hypothetical protein